MHPNLYAIILILFSDIIAIACLFAICRTFQTKLLVGIAIGCFNFASCLGIVFNEQNEKYIISCMLFLIVMVIVMGITLDGKYVISFGNRKRGFYSAREVGSRLDSMKWLGIIYLIIMFVSTIYPTNYFTQLSPSNFTVTGARFALSLARSSGIGWLMGRIKLVLLPFFFIWLYTIRKDTRKFVIVFLLQAFLEMLQNQLITSRSNYLQMFIFIIIYLALEDKVPKRRLLIYTIGFGAVSIVLMVWFKNLIQGNNTTYKGFNETLMALIQSEYNGGQWRLDFCNSVNSELSFFHYLYHCFTAPLFFLPDDGFPTLSYFFTSRVLGLTYGQIGYYVILPGAFGEGLMVLGNYFAWIYGAFIGMYTGAFFRFLKKNEYLRYVYVYFMIQFAFAFRGSLQSFVMRSFNCIFYFMIVMLILRGIGVLSTKGKTVDFDTSN